MALLTSMRAREQSDIREMGSYGMTVSLSHSSLFLPPSLSLSIYLSLSVYLSLSLSLSLALSSLILPSVCLYVCRSVCLSLSQFLSTYTSVSIYLHLCVYLYISVYPVLTSHFPLLFPLSIAVYYRLPHSSSLTLSLALSLTSLFHYVCVFLPLLFSKPKSLRLGTDYID